MPERRKRMLGMQFQRRIQLGAVIAGILLGGLSVF
jgi:hypothetical protein